MGGRPEIAHDHVVTRRALFGPDELRSRNVGWRHYCAACFEAAARQKDERGRGAATDDPEKFLALSEEPASESREAHGPNFHRRSGDWLRIFTDKIPMVFGADIHFRHRCARGLRPDTRSVIDRQIS